MRVACSGVGDDGPESILSMLSSAAREAKAASATPAFAGVLPIVSDCRGELAVADFETACAPRLLVSEAPRPELVSVAVTGAAMSPPAVCFRAEVSLRPDATVTPLGMARPVSVAESRFGPFQRA